jgi:hypothetical protein
MEIVRRQDMRYAPTIAFLFGYGIPRRANAIRPYNLTINYSVFI